jgi:alanyl-tRNA synthetase/misacylated tRNA(Ala) deacylase
MAAIGTPVGSLACQRNPFLRTLATKVLSCSTVTAAPKKGKPSDAPPTYEVVLDDNVLFPEGGGQPCDLGSIDGTAVSGVVRRGNTCVVQMPTPLTEGASVEAVVDWPRRVDHMQQHSGQHLLTAVVEKELGLPTESWALSQPFCCIQLKVASVPADAVARVERICNDMINSAIPVTCTTFPSRDAVPAARSRSIPSDVTGPIRLIDIEGVDSCTCCGTHVENLKQLGSVKLLHQESKGNTVRLFFVFGDRVTSYFGDMFTRERALMKELGTAPENLEGMAAKRGKDAAESAKVNRRLLAEVAALSAPAVVAEAAAQPADKPFLYLREDGGMDFLGTMATALADEATRRVCVLACGALNSKASDGQFMLIGPSPDAVKDFAASTTGPLLEGKGGLSKQGYRGKCNMALWRAMVKALNQAS